MICQWILILALVAILISVVSCHRDDHDRELMDMITAERYKPYLPFSPSTINLSKDFRCYRFIDKKNLAKEGGY
ncbi:hypothetical protein HNY73_012045 [Argiope bruennichi]|uniref:Uncharacterized protein n=1 Tax=Argiope bruennichi TaxID=94029 RepID=A0A8T0EUA4_ARGBR|nr:hypothetical protein HNY73_012045 [Argiope bruennichi]